MVGSTMIEAVLFDMGGVLVELASLPELLGTDRADAVFWAQWLGSPAVRDFERGRCGPEDFARRVVVDLDLPVTPEMFLANFARFPRGLYPGARELVDEVGTAVVTAVVSNTNDLHWRTQPDAAVIDSLCHHNYLSYRIGAVKPDRAVFAHVLADLDLPGDRVMFIDDNAINVTGARRSGLRAAVARGPLEARRVLSAVGVVAAG